ncbi:MAG: hypothetical protein ACW9W4_06265 [Candidatus Nitrosopumilus sp. bin_7KS]
MGETITLEWTSNFTLSWSDFQAESNPAVFEDSHSVIKYRFTWVVDSDIVDRNIVFLINDISLFVEFHPLLSWVRKSEANESLLNHEQGNFDLAELVKRENMMHLQEQFYKKHFSTRGQNDEQRKQFAKEDSGKMINEQVEKLQNLFNERSLKYQNDTNYGKNFDEQLKYDLIFKQLHT